MARTQKPDTGRSKATGGDGKAPAKGASQHAPSPAERVAHARAAAFVDIDPLRAFAHFEPLAAAVPVDGLAVFHGQASVMYQNVVAALKAMEPHFATAIGKLNEAFLTEVFELPSATLALGYAADRVPAAPLSTGQIDQLLAEGAPWRKHGIAYLDIVASPELGQLVPAERVRAIREGTDKLDRARDFTAVAGMFAEFAPALEDKHPFPADKLARLAELGALLTQQIVPGNAARPASGRTPESLRRDQLASIVADRYDHLQVLAAVAVGRARADALLPALRSAVATPTAAAKATPDGPVPPAPAATKPA